jgi:hypothetical protein
MEHSLALREGLPDAQLAVLPVPPNRGVTRTSGCRRPTPSVPSASATAASSAFRTRIRRHR